MNENRYPDEDARKALAAYYAAKEQHPDLLPYMGPQDTLNRFLAGEIVTEGDFLTDQSLWTVQAVMPQQMRRLQWMLDRPAVGR